MTRSIGAGGSGMRNTIKFMTQWISSLKQYVVGIDMAILLLTLFFICSSPLSAEEKHVHDHGANHGGEAASENMDMKPMASSHVHTEMSESEMANNLFASVGVDEKLGEKIPLDLTFWNEKGEKVMLRELVDRPILLQLIFYHCPGACNMMMANLASILDDVTFIAGEGYRIITVSFDHEETPTMASNAKANYMNLVTDEFPQDAWHYLTGKISEIHALTSAVGFSFKQIEQHNFVHPNVLIALGEDGAVIRYLYGMEYLPFDVSMAITEASKGTPSISIKKLLTYCFDYDPKGKTYVFKTFRIFGLILILGLGTFLFFLLRKGRSIKSD